MTYLSYARFIDAYSDIYVKVYGMTYVFFRFSIIIFSVKFVVLTDEYIQSWYLLSIHQHRQSTPLDVGSNRVDKGCRMQTPKQKDPRQISLSSTDDGFLWRPEVNPDDPSLQWRHWLRGYTWSYGSSLS